MLCMSDINKTSIWHSINGTSSTLQSNRNILLNEMKYIFYLANIINGVSSVALYTIAISFIENIFKKDEVNLRQGLYYAVGAVGVGVGMLATGNFLKINSSIKTMRKLQQQYSNNFLLNSNNVNWIGVTFFELNIFYFLFTFKLKNQISF